MGISDTIFKRHLYVFLGTKQSGVSLGDVVLPAWAKSDPREFIRAHREVRYSYQVQ